MAQRSPLFLLLAVACTNPARSKESHVEDNDTQKDASHALESFLLANSPARYALRQRLLSRGQPMRYIPPCCLDDDRIDETVLQADVVVLVGYGAIWSTIDALVSQLNLYDEGVVPVPYAGAQGVLMAALWVVSALAFKGYSPGATRTPPSPLWRKTLISSWAGMSVLLLIIFRLLGQPLEGEGELVFGAAIVMYYWRSRFAQNLPFQ